MPRLLVTGASGFLGAAVAARAVVEGWQVTGTAWSHGRPGLVPLDVVDDRAVGQVVARHRPDAVVHTAYRRSGDGSRSVIVDGSRAVAVAAARVGARLVHLSTDMVFDGRAGRPYTEHDPVCPITDYGRAKAAAEARVAAADPAAVIVRTSLICAGPGLSPGQHERAARDPAGTFYVDEVRCPVQVGDLAAALVELCDAAAHVRGPMHVTGPDALSRWELASLVAGHEVPAGTAPADRPLDCRLDSALARRSLRTRLRGIREVYAAPPADRASGGAAPCGSGRAGSGRPPR